MELSIQERLKDLRVEHGLTLEQLAATRHAPRSFGTFCPEVTSGHFVQKSSPCGASPAGVSLFGRSFCFQGAVHR